MPAFEIPWRFRGLNLGTLHEQPGTGILPSDRSGTSALRPPAVARESPGLMRRLAGHRPVDVLGPPDRPEGWLGSGRSRAVCRFSYVSSGEYPVSGNPIATHAGSW